MLVLSLFLFITYIHFLFYYYLLHSYEKIVGEKRLILGKEIWICYSHNFIFVFALNAFYYVTKMYYVIPGYSGLLLLLYCYYLSGNY